MSYLDNEEWDKRKRAEDALSAILLPPDSTESAESPESAKPSSDDATLAVSDHDIRKYSLIPEEQVKDSTPDVTVYPTIAEDQPQGLPPSGSAASAVYPNLSPPPPEPADLKTDPDTGTRYVEDRLEERSRMPSWRPRLIRRPLNPVTLPCPK